MKRLVPGVGYDLYETADAVSLVINAVDAVAEDDFPFNVRLSGLKFKVTTGTVNSKMPKLDGTNLDDPTPPEKTISASGQVYLKCKHTAGVTFPDTVTVEYDTSTPADSDSYGYVHIATIVVSGGVATKTAQPVRTSLYGERLKCGADPAAYFFSRA